jgi:hypothetical protein
MSTNVKLIVLAIVLAMIAEVISLNGGEASIGYLIGGMLGWTIMFSVVLISISSLVNYFSRKSEE